MANKRISDLPNISVLGALDLLAVDQSVGGGAFNTSNMTLQQFLTALGVSGENRLFNGTFAIDQRNGGSSTAVSDDVYCFDRWYILSQTASVNVSQLTDPEDGHPFAIRVTQNQASAQRFGIAQIVEGKNCKDMRAAIATLSGRVRLSASQAIRYAILEWTGTEDSVTSDVVNDWTSSTYTPGNFFISSNLLVRVVGVTTPGANVFADLASISGTIGSSMKNAIIMLWTEGTAAQNFTLDAEYLQFEKGSLATPMQVVDYPTEFSRCQRYFQKYGNAGGPCAIDAAGLTSGTTAAEVYFNFPTMRVAPTPGLPTAGLSAGQAYFKTGSSGTPATAGTFSSDLVAPNFMRVTTSGASGYTAGQSTVLFLLTGAFLTLSSEL